MRESWRSRLSRLPLPKGLVMLAWKARQGYSPLRYPSHLLVTQAGTCCNSHSELWSKGALGQAGTNLMQAIARTKCMVIIGLGCQEEHGWLLCCKPLHAKCKEALTRSHLLMSSSMCLWRAFFLMCCSRWRQRVPRGSRASKTCQHNQINEHMLPSVIAIPAFLRSLVAELQC